MTVHCPVIPDFPVCLGMMSLKPEVVQSTTSALFCCRARRRSDEFVCIPVILLYIGQGGLKALIKTRTLL